MKLRNAMLFIAVAVAAAVGCQATRPTSASRADVHPSVLDVAPMPAPASARQPPIEVRAEPVAAEVVRPPAAAPAPIAPTITPSAKSYTVKKGDTLFHLAKERYGDGKAWRQIADVNPGVTPGTLKVGQTLVMP